MASLPHPNVARTATEKDQSEASWIVPRRNGWTNGERWVMAHSSSARRLQLHSNSQLPAAGFHDSSKCTCTFRVVPGTDNLALGIEGSTYRSSRAGLSLETNLSSPLGARRHPEPCGAVAPREPFATVLPVGLIRRGTSRRRGLPSDGCVGTDRRWRGPRPCAATRRSESGWMT